MHALNYIKDVLYLLGEDRKKIKWLVVVFLMISLLDLAGLGLIAPYISLIINPDEIHNYHILSKFIKASGIPYHQKNILIILGISLVAVILVKTIVGIYIIRLILLFGNKQLVRLRSTLMHSYQQMQYKDYLQRNSSEYVHAVINYCSSYNSVVQALLSTTSEAIICFAIIIMLAYTNIYALVILVLLLGSSIIIYDRIFKVKVKSYGIQYNNSLTAMVKGVHEGLEGFKELRILGAERYFYKIVHKNSFDASDKIVKSQLISAAPRYMLELILISFLVIFIVVTLLMAIDLLSILPSLGVFGFAALRLLPSSNIFSNCLSKLRFHRHAINQLYSRIKILDLDKINTKSNQYLKLEKFNSLNFVNVSAKYETSKIPSLQKVNFEIRTGESIGIHGQSGSGKTTFLDVLLGLIEPNEGHILYNGTPLTKNISSWRSQVAYLPQQIFLIDNTLKCNVALGLENKEIDEQLLKKSLHQARLTELVEQLPNGIDTLIGERGVRLSGGQRQRIALARAFYHDRNVIVMDESTSSLDNETEKQIVDEINRLKGIKTLIIIAHRLSTLECCDRLYEFNDGKIINTCSYNELIGGQNK